MDIISSAIIGAVAKLSQEAIKDSYNVLKKLIQKKMGLQSDVVTAIEQLEQKPASAGRTAVLEEEIRCSGACNDADLIKAAETLLEKFSAKGGRQTIVQQTVSGNRNIFSGSGNVSVNSHQEE
jgi:hypothetical protein